MRWDDEDARLLGTAFGQLTNALDRFRREAGQRERLSSLGRLSTVIAHEIRNPLMIIKSAVRDLRRHPATNVADAAASIDEEVARLNRVITDVLDFAKPIRFDRAPADLVEICRDAAHAASTGPGDVPVVVAADPERAPLVTDAERLRGVLVNILSNAQQAVRALPSPPAGDPIRVEVSQPSPERRRIRVIDRGTGHRGRRSRSNLRAVLHHQTHRFRSRPGDRPQRRRGAGRHDRYRQPRQDRHHRTNRDPNASKLAAGCLPSSLSTTNQRSGRP